MPAKQTIYDRETGDAVKMFAVQAREALKNHADEWSPTLVTVSDAKAKAVRKRRLDETKLPEDDRVALDELRKRDATAHTLGLNEPRARDRTDTSQVNATRPPGTPSAPLDSRLANKNEHAIAREVEQKVREASLVKGESEGDVKVDLHEVDTPANEHRDVRAATPLRFDPAKFEADDLTEISGIGAATATKLNGMGIVSFRQIAEMTEEQLRQVCIEAGVRSKPDRLQRAAQNLADEA